MGFRREILVPSTISFQPQTQPFNAPDGTMWLSSTDNQLYILENGVPVIVGSNGTIFTDSTLTGSGSVGSPLGILSVPPSALPNNPNAIYATDYGVKADTKQYQDANWVNGANPTLITISGTDAPFTSVDTGKKCFGTFNGSFMSAAMGTFTYVSPTTGTCTGTAIGTPSSNGIFVVGTDDTAALEAATSALYAKQSCGTLNLPAGFMLLNRGIGKDIPARCTVPSDTFFRGAVAGVNITGQGQNATNILPTQGFDFSTCSSNGCFWNNDGVAAAGAHYKYFTINGSGASLAGLSTAPATTLFSVPLSGTAQDLYFLRWADSATNHPNAYGASSGQAGYNIGIAVDRFGNSTIVCGNSTSMSGGSWSVGSLSVPQNNVCYDYGGTYGIGPPGIASLLVQGTLYAFGTFTGDDGGLVSNVAGLSIQNANAEAHLFGAHIGCFGIPAAGSVGVQFLSPGKVVAQSSCIGGSSSGAITGSAGTFIDNGGNVITQGPISTFTGQIYGVGSGIGTLFAKLGTPINGTITYCSDCTIANPCAGSGNGAIAKYLNGTWVCN